MNNQHNSSSCFRLLSSFILHPSSFVLLLALLAAGKAVLYDTIDPDAFWHLRVAEQLGRDGIGPIVDEISYASVKTPWTPYSWLAELGMKAIWDAGGYQLAIVVQAMMMAGFVLFVAMAARAMTRDQNPMAVIIATAVAMFLSLPYLSFRPVTFAIVLLACCSWLLLRDRRMNELSRAVWWIAPITALIINCHFFAVMVPMWVGALLVGSLWEKENTRRYGLMLTLTAVACCCTPMLPGMIQAVLHYQSGDPMVGGGVITEFQPFWKSPIGVAIVLTWIALCLFHTLARYSGRGPGEGSESRSVPLRTGEWLWMGISLILLMRLGRFAPVIAPFLAATFAAAMPAMRGTVLNRRPIQWAVAIVLFLGFIRIFLALPGRNTPMSSWINRHGPDTPGYPTAAADFVAEHIPPGRIINEFTWGGYLAWRLGDDFQILLDGRTQLYTPAFWQATYLGNSNDSRAILEQSNSAAAILPVARSRFRDTVLELGWTSAYRDDRAEVLLPPSMNASINP